MYNFFSNMYDIILIELSFYLNNKSKIKLDNISKSTEILTYIYSINELKNYKVIDNILNQKKFKKLRELYLYQNRHVTTLEPFKNTLIKLWADYMCKIDDNVLKNCYNIQILNADDNEKITTCDPFSNSLIELNSCHDCGLKNFHKIIKLK